MQCSDADALFGCLCNVSVLMHFSSVGILFGCLYNIKLLIVSVFMQCWGVDAMFR